MKIEKLKDGINDIWKKKEQGKKIVSKKDVRIIMETIKTDQFEDFHSRVYKKLEMLKGLQV